MYDFILVKERVLNDRDVILVKRESLYFSRSIVEFMLNNKE